MMNDLSGMKWYDERDKRKRFHFAHYYQSIWKRSLFSSINQHRDANYSVINCNRSENLFTHTHTQTHSSPIHSIYYNACHIPWRKSLTKSTFATYA